MPDKNFDDLAGHFQRKIYDGPKGQIRLAVLLRDLTEFEIIDQPRTTVLDAGGGLAFVGEQFALRGHRVTVCDLSQTLLDCARGRWKESGLSTRGVFHNGRFQDLEERYQVVLCHAVLEWLEEPMAALDVLHQQTELGGTLSLMVFNHTALVWKNLLFGKFKKVKKENLSGFGTSLTPKHSFCRQEVWKRLVHLGFEIQSCTGVRLLRDYMEDKVIQRVGEDKIMEMELLYSKQEPYIEMARYLHFVARRIR